MKRIIIPLFSLFLIGCGNDPLPKPKGFLRLEYSRPKYKKINLPLPFSYDQNNKAKPVASIKKENNGESYGINIEYPDLKGTIYLTYRKVKANNLDSLLRDAQNLTQKHTTKADEIQSNLYENPNKSVYGMFYEVGGNAASQSQFYVTDSINHFLSGSLYFYAKPNYDSIYPAAIYLKNDIRQIMESLEWKD
ncbi:gliding motility lipoprotein GldD [Winogradskyella immobilis]|uniref:Gliding motility lipoprotein GldD n=1 Tax=Winogradskyella immobilis TaxID=2816852 RepID=A0ABS8EJ33_9FLAO|nr:gliding motility lipoprotein GldD [Winogradskyella immobilis]MCC1482966.1 gliding motility lipoprotein GldD [Winogradskyella immobilis]MCG0015061.1 gliding motility lipoprotein GldD [Winogradskyella immobilis]